MAAELKDVLNVDSELVKLRGGVFEVYSDNQLVFSKKQLGRFPEKNEVLTRLRALAS